MEKGCLVEIEDEDYKLGIYLSYDYSDILSKKHRVFVGCKTVSFHKNKIKEISNIPQSNNYRFALGCHWCFCPLKSHYYFIKGVRMMTYYCPDCLR